MNVLVLLAHPRPGSFNHAIAEAVVNTLEQLGHSGFFHDLYAEDFDPVLPPGGGPRRRGGPGCPGTL